MRAYRLIYLNLKYNKNWFIYGAFIIFSIIYAFTGISYFKTANFNTSIGDIFIYLFGGINIKYGNIYAYSNWLAFNLILYFPVLFYIHDTFVNKASFMLPRIKSFNSWYGANVINILIKIFIYVSTIYLIVLLVSLSQYGYSKEVTPNDINNLKDVESFGRIFFESYFLTILSYFFNMIFIIFLYFITKEFKYSFLITICIYYLSAYYSKELLPFREYSIGNNAMLARSNYFKDGISKLNFQSAIIFFMFFIVLLFIINKVIGKKTYQE